MRRRIVLSILALIVPAILVGSFMPMWAKIWFGTPFRDVIIWVPGRLLHFNVHRTVHVIAFGITALLALLLASSWRQRILTVLAVGLLALLTEMGEAVIFHNVMEWPDVLDDATGAAAALMLSSLWHVRTGTSNPAASER
jgi:hypothetical protein